MSAPINDGGPAFPVVGVPSQRGMTLRDWFAGQALAGIWANNDALKTVGEMCSTDEEAAFAPAAMAYKMADHMLKAREEQP